MSWTVQNATQTMKKKKLLPTRQNSESVTINLSSIRSHSSSLSPHRSRNAPSTSSIFSPMNASTPQSTRSPVSSSFPTSNYEPSNSPKKAWSLHAQSIRGKTSEFTASLHYCKPNIICCTESWLAGKKPGQNYTTDAILDAEIFPSGRNEMTAALKEVEFSSLYETN